MCTCLCSEREEATRQSVIRASSGARKCERKESGRCGRGWDGVAGPLAPSLRVGVRLPLLRCLLATTCWRGLQPSTNRSKHSFSRGVRRHHTLCSPACVGICARRWKEERKHCSSQKSSSRILCLCWRARWSTHLIFSYSICFFFFSCSALRFLFVKVCCF